MAIPVAAESLVGNINTWRTAHGKVRVAAISSLKNADIGTMRSNVGAESRFNVFSGNKTAKLGSERNPATVRVQSDARFKEVSATFETHG